MRPSRPTALAVFLLCLSIAPSASAGWLPPWACRDSRELPGQRTRYFEGLRSSANRLLSGNLEEEQHYARLYGAVDDSGRVIRRPAAEVLADPRVRAVAEQQLARFRDIQEVRQRLRQALDGRTYAYNALTNAQLFIRQTLAQPASPAEKESVILRHLASLRSLGFVVVRRSSDGGLRTAILPDGSPDPVGQPMTANNGLYYLDIDRDVRRVIAMDRGSPDLERSRLLQLRTTGDRDTASVEALVQQSNLLAPILDVQLRSSWMGIRNSRLGEFVAAGLGLEDFVSSMQDALLITQDNIQREQGRIAGLSVKDAYLLSRAPALRLEVLAAEPELAGVDCMVQKEWTAATVGYSVTYLVGGITSIGVSMFGHGYLVPVVQTVVALITSGAAISQALNEYMSYRDAQQAMLTGVEGPGLLTREIVQAHQARFYWALGGALVSSAFTVRQVWKLSQMLVKDLATAGRAYSLTTDQLERLGRGNPEELRRFLAGEGVSFNTRAILLQDWRERIPFLIREKFSFLPTFLPKKPSPVAFADLIRVAEEQGVHGQVGILNPETFQILAEQARSRSGQMVELYLTAEGEMRYLVVGGSISQVAHTTFGVTDSLILKGVMGRAYGHLFFTPQGTVQNVMDSTIRVTAAFAEHEGLSEMLLIQSLSVLGIPLR